MACLDQTEDEMYKVVSDFMEGQSKELTLSAGKKKFKVIYKDGVFYISVDHEIIAFTKKNFYQIMFWMKRFSDLSL